MPMTQANLYDHMKFAVQEWVALTELQWRTFAAIFEVKEVGSRRTPSLSRRQ